MSAYGNGAPATGVPFKYTGRRLDAGTGLYYYRARYYWAAGGRFLQVDPVGYKDQMNLYAYTANDPTNKADPSGKVIKCSESKENCDQVASDISSKTDSTYKFNKKGELEKQPKKGSYYRGKTGKEKTQNTSSYYEKRVDDGIKAEKTIDVGIADDIVDPDTGETYSLENIGGGTTGRAGENQTVRYNGQSQQYTDKDGIERTASPAEVLMHELVGHAIPGVAGSEHQSGNGNALEADNLVRRQLGLPERKMEDHYEF